MTDDQVVALVAAVLLVGVETPTPVQLAQRAHVAASLLDASRRELRERHAARTSPAREGRAA